MAAQRKSVAEQVMVITGASSGIGLATAEAAVARHAKLVLAARSENALQEIAAKLAGGGGEVLAVACDIADRSQVEQLAKRAVERFGRIDTWVNNAGIGMYGKLDEIREEDARRLFDVNFWGVVYGSLAALPYLRATQGKLINIGSEVSEGYAPLIGMYVASKHALKGFTDSLRVEVEQVDRSPVSITLIEPTAVDTPFPQHARNYMQLEPKLPSPQIEPARVAAAILEAAEVPTRQRTVGARAAMMTTVAALLPGYLDRSARKLAEQQQSDEPPRRPEGILHRSSEEVGVVLQIHGMGTKKAQSAN
jgi:short-subunit dehydrogenase